MISLAGVSLNVAVTAVGYCTSIWAVSVAQGRLPGVSYNPVRTANDVESVCVLNALGIVAFAFRGHNLILEIQATMSSSEKHPSQVSMWKGFKVAYSLTAACLFPLAIGGYWAHGQLADSSKWRNAYRHQFHSRDVSIFVLGLTYLFVVVNGVCSFQFYGMPIFDDMESQYTRTMKKPCPWWLRAIFRVFFGFLCFFIGVAIPFLPRLAGLVGGVELQVTLAYPCFMWLKAKKPDKYSLGWCLNWLLGTLRMGVSGILMAASIYVIIDTGINVRSFNPW